MPYNFVNWIFSDCQSKLFTQKPSINSPRTILVLQRIICEKDWKNTRRHKRKTEQRTGEKMTKTSYQLWITDLQKHLNCHSSLLYLGTILLPIKSCSTILSIFIVIARAGTSFTQKPSINSPWTIFVLARIICKKNTRLTPSLVRSPRYHVQGIFPAYGRKKTLGTYTHW